MSDLVLEETLGGCGWVSYQTLPDRLRAIDIATDQAEILEEAAGILEGIARLFTDQVKEVGCYEVARLMSEWLEESCCGYLMMVPLDSETVSYRSLTAQMRDPVGGRTGSLRAAGLLDLATLILSREDFGHDAVASDLLSRITTARRSPLDPAPHEDMQVSCDHLYGDTRCGRKSPKCPTQAEADVFAESEGWFVSEEIDLCPEHAAEHIIDLHRRPSASSPPPAPNADIPPIQAAETSDRVQGFFTAGEIAERCFQFRPTGPQGPQGYYCVTREPEQTAEATDRAQGVTAEEIVTREIIAELSRLKSQMSWGRSGRVLVVGLIAGLIVLNGWLFSKFSDAARELHSANYQLLLGQPKDFEESCVLGSPGSWFHRISCDGYGTDKIRCSGIIQKMGQSDVPVRYLCTKSGCEFEK